jgi:hypothetical protein
MLYLMFIRLAEWMVLLALLGAPSGGRGAAAAEPCAQAGLG